MSHTAIIENKRLSHALAVIKAQQDMNITPKVKTNSQLGGYQKRGRKVYGPDYIGPTLSDHKVLSQRLRTKHLVGEATERVSSYRHQ